VIERALQLSENSAEKHLHQIESCTHGIVFLGTPHSGSDFAPFAKAVAQSLKAIGKWVNTDILDILRRDSQTLLDVEDWFGHWLRRRSEIQKSVSITCFFEEYELPLVGKVVSEESARILGYASYGIGADHMMRVLLLYFECSYLMQFLQSMPRFTGREDTGYKRVRSELKRWVKGLVKEHERMRDQIS
jgi:hypothetical protein